MDKNFVYTTEANSHDGSESIPGALQFARGLPSHTVSNQQPSQVHPNQNKDVSGCAASGPEMNYSAPEPQPEPQSASSLRPKYGNLDWSGHKETIMKLYLDEKRTLPEIMRIMKQEYSFDASQKLYKSKFKTWGWNKFLPAVSAYFIVEKAKKRKLQHGKDTIFSLGGQQWTQERAEESMKRHRSRNNNEPPKAFVEDGPTPEGISYKTPENSATSPHDTPNSDDAPSPKTNQIVEFDLEHNIPTSQALVPADLSDGPFDIGDLVRQESPGDETSLSSNSGSTEDDLDIEVLEGPKESISLRWKGYNRSDLHVLERSAKARLEQHDCTTAESLYRESWEGLAQVLGSTHEDTVKVAYHLAEMLAQNNCMAEADAVIETVTTDHIQKLGFKHKKTQAHLLYAIELLNGWDRPEDAGGFVAAALSHKEVSADSCVHQRQKPHATRNRRTRRTLAPGSMNGTNELTLSHVFDMLQRDPTPADLDSGLCMARIHVAAKDTSVEALLKELIKQCERDPGRFRSQHLRARSELISFYDKTDQIDQNELEFANASAAFKEAWRSFDWTSMNFACVEVLEAGLQLAVSFHKCGYETDARDMFVDAQNRCLGAFGASDERTVWALISIGMVYQRYAKTWDEAEEWFQQAYSGALGNKNWGPEDGVTLSLAKALEKRHFAYVTDEGRPYKSIFGVTGITIRPGRLHLD
ncbi:hypothetical protein N8I77_011959 [Diaporthe amygdali]|uniref:Clr5 domain-containing protein n=1 Tax=Phomopsis amygdali TaxID=1214568 RepID=A0AAD9S3X8_PHOAM|nr:hypothetical protein N8I77_011959 [Diaporthe amygdali]